MTQTFAPLWRRLLAFLIDGLVVLGVQMGLLVMSIATPAGDYRAGVTSLAVRAAVTWAYFAVLESSPLQATLGKLALGIRVEDRRGGTLSFGRASLRYWMKTLSTLTLMLGWLMAAFTPRHQALHDVIAGSVVVVSDAVHEAPPAHWDPSVPAHHEVWDGTRWVGGPPA